MKFALSTEQRAFADSLRKLLDDADTPAAVRAWAAGDTGPGRAVLRRLSDAGLTALLVPEEHGGLGADTVDLAVAFVELGRAAVPGPVIETAAVAPALLRGGPADEWLPRVAEGTALVSAAVDVWHPRALDADAADLVLSVGADSVTPAHAGREYRSVDPARRLFDVEPNGTAVAADSTRAIELGVLAAAAQLLGAGRSVVDRTVDYAKNRVQFGRPIGEYQAVKHHLANALVGLEMAEPLLWGAALALQDGSPTVTRDVSAAKIACGDAAYRASRVALQVHGAIGYTAEYDLSLWLTKIRALYTAWGTPSEHRARVAMALRDGALRGGALRGGA